MFRPAGVSGREGEQVVLTLDEFEALRLADLDGLEHEVAGRRMGISRPTFGRVLGSAHQKVAAVLARGACLRIEGGPVLEARRACCRCGGPCTSRGEGACPCLRGGQAKTCEHTKETRRGARRTADRRQR